MKYIIGLLIFLQSVLCAREQILSLGDFGSVHYIYDDQILLHIDRRSPSKELMYRHSYTYNANGQVIVESLIGDLGEIVYSETGIIESPYHKEICERDEKQNLTRHTQDNIVREYVYNDLNELITEEESEESCEYNCVGNVIRVGDVYFDYDDNNRLVEAFSEDYEVSYTYDDAGRRTSKTVNGEQEFYGHFGINDILVVDSSGRLKELRIPGLAPHRDMLRPIAIETPDAIYAPIHDVQSNIVKLVDIKTREVTSLALPDPFGNGLSKDAPTSWIFSGKYYDKEFDLVYFGHRYYSPKLKQWLSPDPAHQTSDLYQYCLNNPFSYCDPDGQFAAVVVMIPLIWTAGVTLTDVIFGTAVVAGVSWAGHEAIKKANAWDEKRMSQECSIEQNVYDRASKAQRKKGRQLADSREMQRNKAGSVDPTLPKDPFKDSGLEDISHPKAKAEGRYTFKDKKTGKVLEYDKGEPNEPGHRAHDHYHRPNPARTGRRDWYLDGAGRPVPKNSEASHLYPPESVWWK